MLLPILACGCHRRASVPTAAQIGQGSRQAIQCFVQALDRLQLAYCTHEAEQNWPAGLSVRWEGPMHQKGVRSVLFVRDGANVPAQWQ